MKRYIVIQDGRGECLQTDERDDVEDLIQDTWSFAIDLHEGIVFKWDHVKKLHKQAKIPNREDY